MMLMYLYKDKFQVTELYRALNQAILGIGSNFRVNSFVNKTFKNRKQVQMSQT
jgi:hypothetical protein